MFGTTGSVDLDSALARLTFFSQSIVKQFGVSFDISLKFDIFYIKKFTLI